MRLEERRDEWLATHEGAWISHQRTYTGKHQVSFNWREWGGTPAAPERQPHQLVVVDVSYSEAVARILAAVGKNTLDYRGMARRGLIMAGAPWHLRLRWWLQELVGR